MFFKKLFFKKVFFKKLFFKKVFFKKVFFKKLFFKKVFFKKVFFKISQNLKENTSAGIPFLIKLWTLGLKLYLKSDFGRDVSLWILRHF